MLAIWVAVCLAAGVALGCGDDHQTTINNYPAAGAGGAGGEAQGGAGGLAGGPGAGGEAQGGSGGLGGSGGSQGGAGGEGGAPCVPLTCADVHGACGTVVDGCGGTVECAKTCGGQPWTSCGAEGVCQCSDVGGQSDKAVCQTPEALAYCEPLGGCEAKFCGGQPNPDAPVGCKWFAVSGGDDVWCCPVSP